MAAIQQLGFRDRGACIGVPHLQASVENDVLVLMEMTQQVVLPLMCAATFYLIYVSHLHMNRSWPVRCLYSLHNTIFFTLWERRVIFCEF